MRTSGRRLVGMLAGLALVTGGGRGLCFMQSAPSNQAATADAHDCCRKGLNDRAPSCCHSQSSTDPVATVKKTTLVPFPTVVAWALPQRLAAVSRDLVSPSPAASHSPPPTVLRI